MSTPSLSSRPSPISLVNYRRRHCPSSFKDLRSSSRPRCSRVHCISGPMCSLMVLIDGYTDHDVVNERGLYWGELEGLIFSKRSKRSSLLTPGLSNSSDRC